MKSLRLYFARLRLDYLRQDKTQLSALARQQLDGIDSAIAATQRRITALECGVPEDQLDVTTIARAVARRQPNITRSLPGRR